MANNFETGITAYTRSQRVVCLTMGLACSVPLTSSVAMANTPAPFSHTGTWQTHAGAASVMNSNYQAAAAPAAQATFSGAAASRPAAFGNMQHASFAALQQANVASVQAAAVASNLNLASARENYVAGNIANFQSLTIDVGGRQQTVNFNTRLTAGELVAAEQVLSGAGQTIRLNAAGVATGGTVHLDNNLLTSLNHSVGGSVSSLTISRGVQVIDTLSDLAFTGNLSNYGSLVTASTSAGNSDNITANAIYNGRGADIGSYNGGGGLFAADPILTAMTSFTNSGSVSSSGNLTISAPIVHNIGASNATATITAANNVNINTQVLDNNGVIAALTGNVNVASNSSLAVIGTGGTMQAAGNINLVSTDADMAVGGGNFFSQNLNMNAGKGSLVAQMQDVTGVVNSTACSVHVGADTDNFRLGVTDATGDPTFTNTGNLVIDSTFTPTAGAPLTLIAGKDIVTDATNVGLNTKGATTGGALTLIAGATFTPFTTALPPTGQAVNVSVTKGSATGGKIDLTGNGIAPITGITTAGTGGGSDGGKVQMIAFAGTAAGSGAISIPTGVTIDAASGGGGGKNGDVTIIAGAKSGTAVNIGNIVGGTVSVSAAAPTVVSDKGAPAGVIFNSTGAQINGQFTPAKAGNVASIAIQNVNSTGNLNILTGGGASVTNNTTPLNLGTVAVGVKGGVFSATNTAAGANGAININGVITGAAASLNEAKTGVITGNVGGSVNTTSLTVNAGTAGTNTFNTNVSTLLVNSSGSSVDVTQGVNTLSLSGGVNAGTGKLSVTSSGQINVTALTKTNNSDITLKTLTGTKGGIAVNAPISVGTGTLNLINLGKGLITELKGVTLNTNNGSLVIETTTNIGSKSAPFLTNGNTIDIKGEGSKVVIYLSDAQTGNLAIFDSSATAGGQLFVTSAASKLFLGSLSYGTVSITDNASNNVIAFSGVDTVGTGTGPVTVSTVGSVTNAAGGTFKGTAVSITATNGIGTNAKHVLTNTPSLTLNSSAGDIYVDDSAVATVNGSAGIGHDFDVTDTATATTALTVGKSVGGGNVTLTTTQAGSGIALTGTTGTANTNGVLIVSKGGITTKGAVSGSLIAFDGTGVITVGGNVGTTATSLINIEAKGGTNAVNINGVVTGNLVGITSPGVVTTTKNINGSGSLSAVVITGGVAAAAGNAIVIGGPVTGQDITLQLNPTSTGVMVLNGAIGNAATSSVLIDDAAGGGISGKGLITGQNVSLQTLGAIGSSKANVLTAATNLSFNNAKNTGGVFITQKGNVTLTNTMKTDNLTLKVTGGLNVLGALTADALTLTSSGPTVIDGSIALGSTVADVNTITSVGFTVNKAGSITGQEGLNIKVTGAGAVNGTIKVDGGAKLNITTTTTFTQGTTGSINGSNDTINAKGAVQLDGAFGNATDNFSVISTGAVNIGTPTTSATFTGTGTVSALTFNNFGTTSGTQTFNITGAGNAFNNYGLLGGTTDTVVINASKGSITSALGSNMNAGTLKLTAGGNAAINNSSAQNIPNAIVKGALIIGSTGGDQSYGGATAKDFTVGAFNSNYVTTAVNTNTVTLNSIATTTGDLTVSANAKTLTVGNGANLTTLAGNITLASQSTNAASTIGIGTNVLIHGSGAKTNLNQGNVYIVFGTVPTNPVNVTPPAGLTTAPVISGPNGAIFYGVNNITADPSVLLNALDRRLIFNTAANPATAITVGAGTTITADPPVDPIVSPAVLVPAAAAVATTPVVTAAAFDSASQLPTSSVNLAAINNATVLSALNNGSLCPAPVGSGIVSGLKPVALSGAGVPTLLGGISNASERSLDRGPLLLAPEHNQVVHTPFGDVSVAAQSVALIVSTDSGLAVYNLHDGRKNAVVINDGALSVAVSPGRSAFLTRSVDAAFEDVNPAQFVGYRQVTSRDAGSSKLHQADFEIMSLVRGLPGLQDLINSDSARTRKTMTNMLKTAAIMMQLTQGGEVYTLRKAPAVTAYAPQ